MSLFTLDQIHIEPLPPFSASLDKGTITTLSGTSGCGKSRLLYALADLLPHQGKALYLNRAATEFVPPQWRLTIMLLPSRIEWWDDSIAAHFSSVVNPHDLKSLNLPSDILLQPIANLSTGQLQRLAILRVIDKNPSVLLLDEPTANLDADNTLAVEKLLQHWVKQDHRAIIWCSHDHEQMQRIANATWTIENNVISANVL